MLFDWTHPFLEKVQNLAISSNWLDFRGLEDRQAICLCFDQKNFAHFYIQDGKHQQQS